MLRYILLPALMALNLSSTVRGAPATPNTPAPRVGPTPIPMPFLHPVPRRSSPVHLTPMGAEDAHKRGLPAVPTIPVGPDPEADVPAALKNREMSNHDWAGGHPQGGIAPETQPDPPAAAPAAAAARREEGSPAGGIPKLNTKDPVEAQINGNSIPPKIPGAV